ncbi:hypothetical protein [Nocardia wallacei]|uniref:Uncharacterized protein n=1 Tax=Nocardia wallacei TaxID=480035 RepID=A0A7G1KYU1_9NOCA|nr:hypothetical protein [Nocardia wallacei]BCK58334.1 hypothetical protein NWFMUON74_61060 [Nocardia wallacei]
MSSNPPKAREVWSPVAVERRLAEIDHLITRGVDALAEAYARYAHAKNELEKANAREYMRYNGPAHAKKYAAIVATAALRDELTLADIAYHYAKSRSEALKDQLSAVQSIGASIRAQYEIAGRGAA